MACVVFCAHLHDAPALRPVYVQIGECDVEFGGVGHIGRFSASMYGMRGAVRNWDEHCRAHLRTFGSSQGRPDLRVFRHGAKAHKALIHGDDYVAIGRGKALTWMADLMHHQYDYTIRMLGSVEAGDDGS